MLHKTAGYIEKKKREEKTHYMKLDCNACLKRVEYLTSIEETCILLMQQHL